MNQLMDGNQGVSVSVILPLVHHHSNNQHLLFFVMQQPYNGEAIKVDSCLIFFVSTVANPKAHNYLLESMKYTPLRQSMLNA